MSAQGNKELVRQFTEEMNAVRGDAARMRSFYQKWATPGYVHHDLARGDATLEQRTQASVAAVAALPDLTYVIDDIVAEGDKTATIFTMRATHKGTYMGIAPTGKQVTIKGVSIWRFDKGKIAESWDLNDTLGIMRQIGAIPTPTAPK